MSNVILVGAGIGGLAAALALHRSGQQVSVYEQAPELGEVGAGIMLTPNSVRALKHIGVYDTVEKLATRPTATRYRNYQTGAEASAVTLTDTFEQRYGSPFLTIHRAELLEAIANGVFAAGPDIVKLGHTLVDCGKRDGQVWARFANGVVATGDILIGCDGVRSTVRRVLHGDQPARFSGHVAFRGTVPAELLGPVHHTPDTFVWVGPEKHVVNYLIKQVTLMNYVAIVERDEWTAEGWNVPATLDEVRREFEGWHADWLEILNHSDPNGLIKWGIFDREPLAQWRKGRISLLGDAAHRTVPYIAQGAAMSLEDGVVLARALDAAGDPEEALQLYEDSRHERTAWVPKTALFFGQLFHDVAGHERILQERIKSNEVLYSYDPATAPLAE
jgi:salicylate hydroxylase